MLSILSSVSLGLAGTLAGPQETRHSLSIGGGSLELRAKWERVTDTVYRFEQRHALIRDLAAAAELQEHAAESFAVFLPKEPVAVGEPWAVDVAGTLPLLRQLHPGATETLHHDRGFGVTAPGGFALLRAVDGTVAEIAIRLHADFCIDGDPNRDGSSWFTPAQFRGRLFLDRNDGSVIGFDLSVPDQPANVDLNVAVDGGGSADIGRVPCMELRGGQTPEISADADQISLLKADSILEQLFYPAAEIEWWDLETALEVARERDRPLHVVALFGSLLDESC